MTVYAARRQRGVVLLAILAVIMLASAWLLVSQLNAGSGGVEAARKSQNAAVLQRAKLALIGYVAAQAAKGYPFEEDNPGALPCPEHAWYIAQPTKEGGAGPSIGVSNPGYGTANCSSIGRFPWRTIGTEKFVDTSNEPLWYVVGPTWRKTSTSTKTVINANIAGDLAVDGEQIVALIIAPGPAMNIQAGTTTAGATCSARNQARNAPAGTMDPLDYPECYNATTLQFSATGPSTSFNDQVVQITAADLLPGIEAAIANRIEREIAPFFTTTATTGTPTRCIRIIRIGVRRQKWRSPWPSLFPLRAPTQTRTPARRRCKDFCRSVTPKRPQVPAPRARRPRRQTTANPTS